MAATLDAPPAQADYVVGQSKTPAQSLPTELQDALSKIAGESSTTKPPPEAPAPTPKQEPPPQLKQEAQPTQQAPETFDHEKASPKQLREAHQKLKTELDSASSKLKALEESDTASKRQIQAAEERVKLAEQALERYKPIEEEAKKFKDRAAELEDKIRVMDYTMLPEFHEKYIAPVGEARSRGHEVVKELTVTIQGQDERIGTEQDFDAVLASPNYTEAVRRAKYLFGDDPIIVTRVLTAREDVIRAERAKQGAFKEAALRSREYQESLTKSQAERQAQLVHRLQATDRELLEKDPTLYRPDPNDAESMTAFEQAQAMADSVIQGTAKTEEERIRNLALLRRRAASQPVTALKLTKAEKRIAELEAELQQYKKSSPETKAATRTSNDATSGPVDIEKQIRNGLEALANRR